MSLFYLLTLTLAEVITTFLNPVSGVIAHGSLLVALLIHATFTHEIHRRNFIASLSLVPLVRIMSLSMPLQSLPQIHWFILIYTPLLIAGGVAMWIFHLKPRDVGLTWRGLHLQLFMGLASGIIFGLFEYEILRPEPLITELNWTQALTPALIILLTTGFVEEFIFLGILQKTAGRSMGWAGLIYTSTLFAILHMGHLSLFDALLVFGIALFYASWVAGTGSLIGASLSHGIINIILYLVAPFIYK